MKVVLLALVSVSLAVSLTSCGGAGPLGIGSASNEPIDYSPRAPLVMPPPDQLSVLPPPQNGPAVIAPAQHADVVPEPPPASYNSAAPVPAGNPPEEEHSTFFGRMFN